MSRLTAITLFCWLGLASMLAAQPPMTNDDLVKLARSGLSEEFVLNLIQQQPANLYTDAGRLVELKDNGVSENLIMAAVKKSPSQEPLTTYGLMQLTKANFSDNFLLDLIAAQPARVATDTGNIIQLKQAGVSERVLSALIAKAGNETRLANREVPSGTQITVRLIDGIDSEKSREGELFKASLDDPLIVNGETFAPRGADATVRLATSKESGKLTGRAELTVELASVMIGGQPVAFDTSSVSQASGSRGERTAKVTAGTAAVGAIIGAIAGGGRGAAIGAGAGAAAGAGSQVFMKGQRVRIPSETFLTFTTASAVKVP